MSKRIFIALSDYTPAGISLLEKTGYEIILNPEKERPSEKALGELVRDYEVLVIGVKERMTEHVYQNIRNLEILATLSIGLDHIDSSFFDDDRLKILNAPGSNSISVAEHTIGLMLALSKRFMEGHEASFTGTGRKGISKFPGEIRDKTIGVIGAGSIGTEVMKMSLCLGMKVLCYTFHPESHPDLHNIGVTFYDLQGVVSKSDIISIHLPLTKESRNLLSDELIEEMKGNSIVVNTSRPEIVDMKALAKSLKDGKILGVGIDSDDIGVADLFRGLKNVIITPHIAGLTNESFTRMDMMIAEAILQTIVGR
jgi:D-3-phosphoglycerate dehydrogenase